MLSICLLPVFCNHLSTTPATMTSEKRKRKCNFTTNELLILEENMAIEENRKIITSKFTDAISNEQKRLKWEEIAAKCSSAGPVTRTGQEVRDKWQSMKSHAKRDITE